MSITTAQMINALADTLATATGINAHQGYAELSEDVHDFPMVRVWFVSMECDPFGMTDRTTMQAVVRQYDFTFQANVVARQRSNSEEDSQAVVDVTDAVIDKFDEQDLKPYFGLDGIQAFRYTIDSQSWRTEGGAEYVGVTASITIRVF